MKELHVETVETYKSLGTMFDFSLKFDKNTEAIVKQGQQKIYLWQKLNSFNVSQSILCHFYYSFIESLLTFSFICWFYGLSIKEKNSLSSIIEPTDLSPLWKTRAVQNAKQIMSHPDHILTQEFCLMPSGRRHLPPDTAIHFFPSAIRLLNAADSIVYPLRTMYIY